jgi:secreted PhoX family phosphatase
VQEYTKSGTAVTVSGGSPAGVAKPMSLFIDGTGQVWVANGNNSVSVLNNAGAAVSPSTGYQSGNLSMPSGIVVDSAGSVWVTNRGNNSVSKILGAATPVVTPTVTGTTNKTLGTRP